MASYESRQDVQKGRWSHPPNPGAPGRAVPRARPQRGPRREEADGRESVSAQCLKGEAYFGFHVQPLSHPQNKAGGLFQRPVTASSACAVSRFNEVSSSSRLASNW